MPTTPRPHVLTFVALGGEGKTALVAKWAAELAAQDWPGCEAAFAWSFYSQGTREQQAAYSDLFLKEALAFFGDDADKAFAASPAGAFEKADEKMDGGHALRTLAAYEQWLLRDGGEEGRREVTVLRLMGLFDRPADAGCLDALRRETICGLTEPLAEIADDDWEYCLSGLASAKLLTVNRDAAGALLSLDAHPPLREYFAKQLREKVPGGWRAGHQRLYEYFKALPVEHFPTTLEEMLPLYQAIFHGCHGSRHTEAYREVYRERVCRGQDRYSTYQLGATGLDFGAIQCLCLRDATQPALDRESDFGIKHDLGMDLWHSGGIREALQPLRTATALGRMNEKWCLAAGTARILAEAQLTLGEFQEARRWTQESIDLADHEFDSAERAWPRTAFANVLHNMGYPKEAYRRFLEAEDLHRQKDPRYEFLPSYWGFWYVDLLLSIGSYDEAITRTKWYTSLQFERPELLRLALHHLGLSRALLLKADPDLTMAEHEADLGLRLLRESNQQPHLPRGLLVNAEVHRVRGRFAHAHRDLEEAAILAQAGDMKLWIADCHLASARIYILEFETRDSRPGSQPMKASEALADARAMLDRMRFGRRRPDFELAAARLAVLKGQQRQALEHLAVARPWVMPADKGGKRFVGHMPELMELLGKCSS